MAQQQCLVTVTGYVGANPVPFNKEGNPHASSFRLASTRRYFDGRTQQWRDLPTTWITVKSYRALSENICQSFKKGEPVVVSGLLAMEAWTDQNGRNQSKIVLEANAAGHDLNYGITTWRRIARQNGDAQRGDDARQEVESQGMNGTGPVEVDGGGTAGASVAGEEAEDGGEFDSSGF